MSVNSAKQRLTAVFQASGASLKGVKACVPVYPSSKCLNMSSRHQGLGSNSLTQDIYTVPALTGIQTCPIYLGSTGLSQFKRGMSAYLYSSKDTLVSISLKISTSLPPSWSLSSWANWLALSTFSWANSSASRSFSFSERLHSISSWAQKKHFLDRGLTKFYGCHGTGFGHIFSRGTGTCFETDSGHLFSWLHFGVDQFGRLPWRGTKPTAKAHQDT